MAVTLAACTSEVPSAPQPVAATPVTTTVSKPLPGETGAAEDVERARCHLAGGCPPAPPAFRRLRRDRTDATRTGESGTSDKRRSSPPAGNAYASTISVVPAAVLARSTWQAACPVKATDLRYLTMAFWGFDGRAHTGEMLVNASGAAGITKAFGKLFAAHFPLEEMRVTSPAELTLAPTGDGNSTSAFVCRPARGQTTWSAHAYGLAVDVNPFCNPYTQGDLVLPELASAYVDRSRKRPGMVLAGDATVRAFAAIGWSWGGAWTSPKDRMHFTANGH